VDVILEPSRFVTELPEDVSERWTVELEAGPEAGEGTEEDTRRPEPVN
jgi:hypothetical protein